MPFLNRLRQNDIRTLCAWGLLLAFLLRAIVPVGYMPDFSKEAAGFFPIKICHGDKLATIFVDQNQNPVDPAVPHKNNSQAQDRFSCPFSIGNVFASTVNIATLTFALVFLSIGIFSFVDLRLIRKSYIGNAAPRAPPVFS